MACRDESITHNVSRTTGEIGGRKVIDVAN